ncbi:MAG: hypothetical protein HY675_16870 [Chloroflexi bacterium]|nr:hypothetical protein [Chloroflexota bacterium]
MNFALGVYILTLVVALFVVLVIMGIRHLTADRQKALSPGAQPSLKKEEARA